MYRLFPNAQLRLHLNFLKNLGDFIGGPIVLIISIQFGVLHHRDQVLSGNQESWIHLVDSLFRCKTLIPRVPHMNKHLRVKAAIFFAAASFSVVPPASAQTVETCEIIDSYIPIEKEFLWPDSEAGYINGDEAGSQVNVRTGPGIRYEASTYGLVGNYIEVIGQALDSECHTWLKVKFPISDIEGWIHSNFIALHSGPRGLWD